jgi:ubiquinone/menaquinone biosynthesis C-methylase UbiE
VDVLTSLDPGTDYSSRKLQLIIGAWVMSGMLDRKDKVSLDTGHVEEADYTKQSIYSLLYSMYRTVGEVRSEHDEPYEMTFNTWGYAWPAAWGDAPTTPTDPQRFGKNAYTGLFAFDAVKDYVRERKGQVHVVEMGCGTGGGAHHVCKQVLPECTYHAIDMQQAAIQTCKRKFVPELDGRLNATCGDATKVSIEEESADFVVICETHVTEYAGRVSAEDEKFFQAMYRVLKPGGFLVWGNAIPDTTWQPCFDHLASIGMEVIEEHDVTPQAVLARDEDEPRVEAYVEQCLKRFAAFRIPVLGRKKRLEAQLALMNFYRNPGTNLYANMTNGTDSYRVVLARKGA